MARLFRLSTFLLFLLCSLSSCHRQYKTLSFYYWRTSYHLDSIEKAALTGNSVKTLYLRYFDVDRSPEDSLPHPVSPISFADSLKDLQVIPVIYCRNRVFEKGDSASIIALAQHIFHLVAQINAAAHAQPTTLQFDCDWTDKTKNLYFFFLRYYQSLTTASITCTIRLHQIKYPLQTGIPPVRQGILMYYNMGEINTGGANSIYERSIAARYISALPSYPLSLDVALPIFAWGLQVREGHVIRLLDKMNFLHFENDTNFVRMDNTRFRVRSACFHGGYYFKTGDEVKTETVTGDQLEEMADDIRQHTNHRLQNLILYDLDKTNLVLYDKAIFQKVLDHLD